MLWGGPTLPGWQPKIALALGLKSLVRKRSLCAHLQTIIPWLSLMEAHEAVD